jgi:hypothetical protein
MEEIYQRLPKVWDWQFIIGKKIKPSKLEINSNLTKLKGSLSKLQKEKKISTMQKKQKTYFFLHDQQRLVKNRLNKEKFAQKREKSIAQVINYLNYFPSIKAVALTGSSAVKNASLNDDLDFCIIVRKNTLWITRFFLITLTKILAKQPKIGSHKKNTNKQAWCFNLFLDEGSLNIEKRSFSIYQAYELKQMEWLLIKNDLDKKIFLENLQLNELITIKEGIKKSKSNNVFKLSLADLSLWPLNLFFFTLQKIYRRIFFGNENYFLSLRQAHFNDFLRQNLIFQQVKKKMISHGFQDF